MARQEPGFCLCEIPTIKQFGDDRFLCESCGRVISPNTMKALQIQLDFKDLADMREAAANRLLVWIGPSRTANILAHHLRVPARMFRFSDYRSALDRVRGWKPGMIVLFFTDRNTAQVERIRGDCQYLCECRCGHRFFDANALLDRLSKMEG